jgi:DNA-binding NarL/FixJ family response regulator
MKVLLCDDAVAFSVLFTRWMTDGGIDVVGPAATADKAVEMAGEHHPDVIVVDHLLRDVTSDLLVPRLREAAPGAGLLLISGMAGETLAEAAAAAGADAHLSKAADAGAMRAAVRALAP